MNSAYKYTILTLALLGYQWGCFTDLYGQEDLTNLTHKEAYLLKFKSIFSSIHDGESWNDYQSRLMNNVKLPGTLGPGALNFTVDPDI